MIDLSGEILGQYQLIEQIGKGGMATVYRAVQISMGRTVAIKVIAPDLAEETEFLSRFTREAQIIASLQHPNILEVHDFGRQGKFTYLAMRLMSGGSLKDELRAGDMTTDRVIQIVQQIASALDYAHVRGIVHRDLKPSNVLLDEDRNVALTDFGIAKMVGGGHALSGDLTLAGEVVGTPKYMAPEQWRSESVDGRADIYALGILIYQMLTGRVPFSAQTPHSLMYQHLDRTPTSPHDIRPDLPFTLDPVIQKALAKDRNQRYDRAGVLAADLQHVLRPPDPPSGQGNQPMTWHTRASRPIRPQPDDDSPADLANRSDQPKRPRRTPDFDPLAARHALDQLPERPRERSPERSPERAASNPRNSDARDTASQDNNAAPRPPRERRVAEPAYQPDPPPALHPYEQIAAQQPYEPEPAAPETFSDAYSVPYSPPVYEVPPPHRPRAPQPNEAGIGRFFSTMAAVIVGLGLFFAVVFVIALLSLLGDEEATTTPGPKTPAATGAPTSIPDSARANAEIIYPPDNTRVKLGDVVPIQFTVTHSAPITRVELRWFNQIIARIPANNTAIFSSEINYPVTQSGLHTLEVVPFSGEIEGHHAVVHLTAE